jgi:NADPH:quinone reductase-like Zn-dependent oxidoreductase
MGAACAATAVAQIDQRSADQSAFQNAIKRRSRLFIDAFYRGTMPLYPKDSLKDSLMRGRFLLVAGLGALAVAGAAAQAQDMQACVVSGGRIHLLTVARPIAGAGQIVVKLKFAGINPADWKRASGKPEDPDIGIPVDASPLIPGLDGAGVVESIGAGVRRFRIGDPVLLWSRHGGTYAQYVAVRVDDVVRKPPSVSFPQAAGIPHAGLAAWNLIHDVAKVRAGQTVLVLGGAGGVGSAVVQIANNAGAHVIATASAGNADYLKQLGAETVIDYHRQHFEEQVRNVDVAVNLVDADNAYRALAVVKRGGYLLSLSGLPAASQCASRGVVCSQRTAPTAPDRVALAQILQWTQSGRFAVNIDRTFELKDVQQAWTYSQAGHTRGKAVVHIAE